MSKEVNIRIGECIREHFENMELQQHDVANRLEISQSAVSAYYRGKPFGKNAAQKWADAFGFRANWLLTGEGPMLKSDQPENPMEEQPSSNSSLIDYLQRKVAELEGKIDKLNEEKADLLQENAVLKYENQLLAPQKGRNAEDAESSLSVSAAR